MDILLLVTRKYTLSDPVCNNLTGQIASPKLPMRSVGLTQVKHLHCGAGALIQPTPFPSRPTTVFRVYSRLLLI